MPMFLKSTHHLLHRSMDFLGEETRGLDLREIGVRLTGMGETVELEIDDSPIGTIQRTGSLPARFRAAGPDVADVAIYGRPFRSIREAVRFLVNLRFKS